MVEKGNQTKIMVVDDTPQTLEILRRCLTHEGYMVKTIAQGREALRVLAEENFDLVISDIIMPGVTGYEIAASFLKGRSHRRFILMSGSELSIAGTSKTQCQSLEFLAKPFTHSELLSSVERALAG